MENIEYSLLSNSELEDINGGCDCDAHQLGRDLGKAVSAALTVYGIYVLFI